MKTEQIDIKLNDKASVKITLFEPENSRSNPVILLTPAMGVQAKYYLPFCEKLTDSGFVCVTADLRGLGLSSERPSSKNDWGYWEMIEDLKVITDAIKSKFPNRKIYHLGHSLGGQISLLAAAKYPNSSDGFIFVAANSIYYKSWSGIQKWNVFLGYCFFPLISKLVGYFPGDKIGFGGKAAKTQLIDWGRAGRRGRFEITGDDFDYEAGMKKLIKPVLAVYIENDWMSPKKAMAHLYGKLDGKSEVTNFTLTEASTGRKLNHFKWVKNSERIVEEIKSWTGNFNAD